MSIELIRGELERLFSLEEMLNLSEDLLGFEPELVGGTASTASFARALTDHCRTQDAIAALIDAVTSTKPKASPKLYKFVEDILRAPVDLKAGSTLGPFKIVRKIGAGPNGTVYSAKRDRDAVVLKLLHTSAVHDKSSLYRFLTRTRLLQRIDHDGLPDGLEAGFVDDKPYVAYNAFDGKPLAARVARTGALHANEARALLHSLLSALGAMHEAKLVHGSVKLENVLVSKKKDGPAGVVLVDAGGDLLSSTWIHSDVATKGGNRIKGMSPEQLKGLATTVKSDMYAFGALLFELLTGKPPFEESNATDLAVAHLAKTPANASELAPRGWVSKELAELCGRLLDKSPGKRPDINAVLAVLGPLEKGKDAITEEQLNDCIDGLVADPSDTEAAIALELTLERQADPSKVADAFLMAADELSIDEAVKAARTEESSEAVAQAKAEAARDRARDLKKGLLFRAARLFETQLKDHARAEDAYKLLTSLDPDDEVAQTGYEAALKAQEKYEDLVECLLEIGENSESHSARARALNKIGHLYAGPLDEVEQAVFAFAQALAQEVQNEDYAEDLEKVAGDNLQHWAEAMRTLHEVSEHPSMPQETRVALFMRLGNWYVDKVARPDLALPCFEAVLQLDPAQQGALEGMTDLYRRAQQWNELTSVLLSRAERAPTPERTRDLRAEAAAIMETRLDDLPGARELYEVTLKEDPGHQTTVDALARIYRKDNDYTGYVKILEQQADARTGQERAETMAKIGEIYEDELDDLVEAQRRFEAALESDAGNMNAIRGLDRIFSRTGRFDQLLENLNQQLSVAATPRQKINLHERIAGIYDEEFLNHEKAAEALECVLELDSAHEGSLMALMRHYRVLDRWDEVIDLYDRMLRICTEEDRRVELLLSQGRVLLEQIGSPERARLAYENVLKLRNDHAGALESLAHVRAATGDAMAALSAVESLAEKAESANSKADLWLRAATILEEHGDRDGAIARYKLSLDAQPENASAALGLRAAYLARGDAAGAIEVVSQQIELEEGKLAKARLFCELAELQRDKMKDAAAAREAAVKASDLDATNIGALMVLGDLAFDAESFVEASTHYGALATRVEALEQDVGKHVLMRYIDTLARSGSTEKALSSVEALLERAGDDPKALQRAARVRLDAEDGDGAAELFKRLLDEFGDSAPKDQRLSDEDRGSVLLNYGKALRVSGAAEKAIKPLHEACDVLPDAVEPINELARCHEVLEQWDEVVRIKQRRLDVAEGEERSMLLLEIGEVYATSVKDSTRAAKNFVAALEERPDDRRVLTRLMKLYSEEKDWGKLVEVVVKLAEGVEDPLQKAKYVHTAAVVSARQIGDFDKAVEFLDQVLELDPTNEKATKESIHAREQKGDWDGVVEFVNLELERAEKAGNKEDVLAHIERLADVYEQQLGKTEEAMAMLERAQQLDSDNAARTERLALVYATDSEKYLDKAVGAQMAIIARNPFDASAYRALRKLNTEAKEADPAWCVCQALHCMNCAEPDEERFFKRMRAETSAEARERVSVDEWGKVLTHPRVEPLVTAIFQIIEPAVLEKNAQSLEKLGYSASYALDLSMHPYPMSQTLYYAGGVLGMDLPMTFQNPQDPGGISFLHAQPPSIVLGAAALAAELPTQAGAFIAARHLTYYRPGFYIRHLVATGTGLRAWLFAAIRLIHSAFPVAEELESTIMEKVASIEGLVSGPRRDQLASAVSKLLQGGSIDLKSWVASVDLSADRAGLLVCHDLEVASEMIRASDEATAAIPHSERIRELTLFSVSRDYFAMRKRLGINIDA